MLAHDIPIMFSPPWQKPSPRVRSSIVRQRPCALALAALTHLPDSGDFAAWRGRSGRRYVVTRHTLNDDVILSWSDIVLIAVRQNVPDQNMVSTVPTIVGVCETGVESAIGELASLSFKSSPALQPSLALQSWLALMRLSGATCLDVHLGLADPALRAAAIADLAP